MKLLFDQNCSPRLVQALADIYPVSTHVQTIGLGQSTDTPVWEYALHNDYVIVTKDVDFSERSALLGHPPKIIWIRMGNCTTKDIEAALRTHNQKITAFERDPEFGVFAIY